jgi:YesN/AraC family two-component response regulator
MAYNILLVDDDEDFREEFRDFLEEYNIVEASSGQEALDLLGKPNEIDLVILDVIMPGLPGTKVLKRIKEMTPDLAVIILTGYGTKTTVIEALKGRADDYIEKPVDIGKTKTAIERLLRDKVSTGDVIEGGIGVRIKRVMHFVERNYDKKVSLGRAAEIACLSPKYLSRVFKQTTGMGFSEYKLRVRMVKAGELLATTDRTIDRISYEMGYENPESFTRLFKKVTGKTPTEYRRTVRTEAEEGAKIAKRIKRAKRRQAGTGARPTRSTRRTKPSASKPKKRR